MTTNFDCIVLGVGGFGSGVLYQLARRGVHALGIERFGIAHDRGSSHGETRIIRKAYVEHLDYIPLMDRAYQLWELLQSEHGQPLLHKQPLLLTGTSDSEAIEGAKLAARLHGVGIEQVSLADARRRFPGLRFPDDFEVALEPDAGYLEVENCVRAHIEQAKTNGAVLKTGETVLTWESDGRTVRVKTDRADYEAAKLVVTAGPWTAQILGELNVPLEVVRKPTFWHEVTTRDYDAAAGAPTTYFELPFGTFYAFPSIDGQTIKLAEHTHGDPVTDPLTVDREVRPADIEPVARFLRQSMPGIRPEPTRHSICMYTNTPDRNFIIDRHPEYENVAIGAGFSGHGFKFTTVLGEALADLVLQGKTDLPISFLAIDRETLK